MTFPIVFVYIAPPWSFAEFLINETFSPSCIKSVSIAPPFPYAVFPTKVEFST